MSYIRFHIMRAIVTSSDPQTFIILTLSSCDISLPQFQTYNSRRDDIIMNINVPSMIYSYPSLDISCRDNKCNQQRSKQQTNKPPHDCLCGCCTWTEYQQRQKGGFALGINMPLKCKGGFRSKAQGFFMSR